MRVSWFLPVILLLALVSCDSLVNSMAFFPDTRTSIPAEKMPSYLREVDIKTGDNVRLHAYLMQHKGRSKRILLYFHGNAGNISHRVNDASKIYRMGCDVLLVSYRGYGRSEGTPSERGVYEDGISSFKYITQNLGYKEEGIIIYGRSLGSAVAVYVAQNRNISHLVLVTPLSSGREYAQARGFGLLRACAGNAFDSLGRINNISCPLLIIHGDRDRVIPRDMGLRLYRAYRGEKQFITIDGGGHNDLQDADPELFWSSISDLINK